MAEIKMLSQKNVAAKKNAATDEEVYICRKCGHRLTRKNVTPGYQFYCPNCDEDMYGIEARRR